MGAHEGRPYGSWAGLRRRPYARGKRRGFGVGCRGLWFDTGLRKTPARLTTNGVGRWLVALKTLTLTLVCSQGLGRSKV